MKKFVLLFLLLLLIPVVAAAQPVNVTASTTVVFTPSADHAKIDTYEFGYFSIGAADPIQAVPIAKGALQPQGADVKFVFPRLLFGGPFEHRLRGCAPSSVPGAVTVCSEWVTADKQTNVAPFPASALRIQ